MSFVSRKTKDENYPSVKERMIVWNTKTKEIAVQVWPRTESDRSEKNRYNRSWGACSSKIRNSKGLETSLMLFQELPGLIIRDGLSPVDVHNALLGLKEYRQHLAFDIPGYDGAKYHDGEVFG